MRILFLVLFFFSSIGAAELSTILCNNQYALDMNSTIVQFSGFTPAETLKEYRTFMIMVKHKKDLGFRIRVFEHGLSSEERAFVRTPMQHYGDCRTSITSRLAIPFGQPGASGSLITPCDKNYAIESQNVLSQLEPSTEETRLQEYKNFMIMLKQYEDLRYKITDYEKEIPLNTITKLRGPMKRYEKCMNTVIRVHHRYKQ